MENGTLFDLKSETLDAIPIINHFIKRLNLEDILEQYITYNNMHNSVSPVQSIGILLRNIILGREPVYGLKEWTSRFAPDLFHLKSDQVDRLNDDKVGRALEKLFDADRASLMTEVVVNAIHEFKLELKQLHNDSTTVTFSGKYEDANGNQKRGKKTLKITRGNNKDHRPDLKQLLWILTVTADGAVPIHYRACDGNTTDDTTHIDTWKTLCNLVGRKDFTYVADCKLCVSDTLKYIDGEGGRFITVMPQTRSEDKWFRDYIVKNNVSWNEIRRDTNPYAKDDQPNIWRAVESPILSAEGFRIVWYWSSQKAEHDMQARQAIMEKTIIKLEQLQTRLLSKRCRLHTREAVAEAADNILKDTDGQRCIRHEIKENVETTYRQAKSGRPGPDTKYVAHHKTWFQVEWHPIGKNITSDACSDGVFPLITNRENLSHKEILGKYKYQPKLEKRYELLKTVDRVTPVLLKNATRIEALLFVYFLALLIQALIERQIRLGMKDTGLQSLPIYCEERECSAPTASRTLDAFGNLQRHYLMKNGEVKQIFDPTYTDLQGQILDLLGVPREVYPGMVD